MVLLLMAAVVVSVVGVWGVGKVEKLQYVAALFGAHDQITVFVSLKVHTPEMSISESLLSWVNTFLDFQVESYDELRDGNALAAIVEQM